MGRVVIVVPLRAGTSRDALDLLRSGPPIEIDRLERSMAYLSSDEAVMVLEGPDLNPKDGRPWEDPSAWRDGARWVRCAASTPRIAATVLAWERSPDLQGVFFGPLPGPGDSEGGDALAGGVPPV